MRADGTRRVGRPARRGETYNSARTRKEIALADLRQFEVRKRRGELLDAGAVEREWHDVLRQVRAGVLAVVSRVRAQLPHLSAHDVEVLDRELRSALTSLADEA